MTKTTWAKINFNPNKFHLKCEENINLNGLPGGYKRKLIVNSSLK